MIASQEPRGERPAPGAPGVDPTWSSSDKDFVAASLGPARMWVTGGHGIVNEVYWPSTGEPQLRDLGFHLVRHAGDAARSDTASDTASATATDEGADANAVSPGCWIDLKRVDGYRIQSPDEAVPLVTIVHAGSDYTLRLHVLPDPHRDVLLIHFELDGPYTLVMLVAPHLGGSGHDNTAWVAEQALFATRGARALCITADVDLEHASVGYVGTSDGWQDLARHGRLSWAWDRAGPGNVALVAQLAARRGVIAMGVALSACGAETQARGGLAMGFDAVRRIFIDDWVRWGRTLALPAPTPELGRLARISATVLRAHEDHTYPGALVASLSTPWGNTSDTLGGYHLVWPRDATLSAFALVAIGQIDDARRVLAHFIATQEADGHWAQNTYPSGEPFWNGVQLDEAAFPVLLAAKLREAGATELAGTAAMVQRATAFVARNGPASEQDRWEENPGVNAFTVAVAMAALVAAQPWLTDQDDARAALAFADEWNERLDLWCYVSGTPLAERIGVAGYYMRLGNARCDPADGARAKVQLRNREGESIAASDLVGLDFSYLPRLGIRAIDDPKIVDSVRVVDATLKVDTPSGPLYHRYTDDGYGEHADGSPFDGRGVGGLWPLLAGERGHLALQAGADPLPWLQTMAHCASSGGLLPEQVWAGAPMPERGLLPGRPSGSAMPLLWAHAEFLKLLIARERGKPVECLDGVAAHFKAGPAAAAWHWRDSAPVFALPHGRALVILGDQPFSVHHGFDGWQQLADRDAQPGPFGLWQLRFEAAELAGHQSLEFTRHHGDAWEGVDHAVRLTAARAC